MYVAFARTSCLRETHSVFINVFIISFSQIVEMTSIWFSQSLRFIFLPKAHIQTTLWHISVYESLSFRLHCRKPFFSMKISLSLLTLVGAMAASVNSQPGIFGDIPGYEGMEFGRFDHGVANPPTRTRSSAPSREMVRPSRRGSTHDRYNRPTNVRPRRTTEGERSSAYYDVVEMMDGYEGSDYDSRFNLRNPLYMGGRGRTGRTGLSGPGDLGRLGGIRTLSVAEMPSSSAVQPAYANTHGSFLGYYPPTHHVFSQDTYQPINIIQSREVTSEPVVEQRYILADQSGLSTSVLSSQPHLPSFHQNVGRDKEVEISHIAPQGDKMPFENLIHRATVVNESDTSF